MLPAEKSCYPVSAYGRSGGRRFFGTASGKAACCCAWVKVQLCVHGGWRGALGVPRVASTTQKTSALFMPARSRYSFRVSSRPPLTSSQSTAVFRQSFEFDPVKCTHVISQPDFERRRRSTVITVGRTFMLPKFLISSLIRVMCALLLLRLPVQCWWNNRT